ncbi:uncharacterized protein L3040_001002 [Drepanopeziza brunnea f. sp. 'multigermtubi']|uniref:uncharacterized protein n=1 Tax=Drepanopeziza brunnea f. sp. 'multigermtubi' TaxID=698441 RepID=UPI0023A550BF|nr:hypothetical protein L3040_001002 [Drepanopeziza brunnea f. sp. 'multigermtubi']
MAHPMTFGVELEFAVAMIFPNDTNPNPSDPRTVIFKPTTEEYTDVIRGYQQLSPDPDPEPSAAVLHAVEYDSRQPAVFRAVSQTLQDAGFPVVFDANPRNETGVMPTSWEVIRSDRARVDRYDMDAVYKYMPVKVRSPAYTLTEENLERVRQVCLLIRKTYISRIHETMALHVHIGYGDEGFTMETVRDLLAFTWAFEPQFDSLHPEAKLQDEHCESMRDQSYMANVWYAKHGERMTPLQGVVNIWGVTAGLATSIGTAFHPAFELSPKNQRVSFCGLFCRTKPPGERLCTAIPTIEFRQHKATLFGERVTMWIETVAGVVRFVKNAEKIDLLNLFELLKHEKWEKLGDGNDAQREEIMGPILADHGFTIIDLLRHTGLEKQADYYEDQWNTHERTRFIPVVQLEVQPGVMIAAAKFHPRFTRWQYLEEPGELSDAQLNSADASRVLWEQMSRVVELYKDVIGKDLPELTPPQFDPEDPDMWPIHMSSFDRETGGEDVGRGEL